MLYGGEVGDGCWDRLGELCAALLEWNELVRWAEAARAAAEGSRFDDSSRMVGEGILVLLPPKMFFLGFVGLEYLRVIVPEPADLGGSLEVGCCWLFRSGEELSGLWYESTPFGVGSACVLSLAMRIMGRVSSRSLRCSPSRR